MKLPTLNLKRRSKRILLIIAGPGVISATMLLASSPAAANGAASDVNICQGNGSQSLCLVASDLVGGETVQESTSGSRVFDVTADGTQNCYNDGACYSNYDVSFNANHVYCLGLYADYLAKVRVCGSDYTKWSICNNLCPANNGYMKWINRKATQESGGGSGGQGVIIVLSSVNSNGSTVVGNNDFQPGYYQYWRYR